jgi:hypothetical protein
MTSVSFTHCSYAGDFFMARCSQKNNLGLVVHPVLTTVVAPSKAWTVFARLNAGIVCSNTTQGLDVCLRLFCICVVLCVGSGFVTDWSPVNGVLPTMYKIKKLRRRPVFNKELESRTKSSINIWLSTTWHLSNCIYLHQHKYCRYAVYINYLLHVSAFRPSWDLCIHCWLHCSLLILSSVCSGYILCCRFGMLECNDTIMRPC